MYICPECGHEITKNTKTCIQCGFPFEDVFFEEETVLSDAGNSISKIKAEDNIVKNFGNSNENNYYINNKKQFVENNQTLAGIRVFAAIVYIVLAVVVLIMSFSAARSILEGGNEIMKIQSVGGRTLEEAYYQELGEVYAGQAMMCRTIGVFFAAVLVWMGLRKNK